MQAQLKEAAHSTVEMAPKKLRVESKVEIDQPRQFESPVTFKVKPTCVVNKAKLKTSASVAQGLLASAKLARPGSAAPSFSLKKLNAIASGSKENMP